MIGIIVRAIRKNQRTKPEVLAILRTMVTQSTLHLKPSLLETVIRQVEGEESRP